MEIIDFPSTARKAGKTYLFTSFGLLATRFHSFDVLNKLSTNQALFHCSLNPINKEFYKHSSAKM